MAEFRPYAGIEGAALTGGEGGDFLHNLLVGVLRGTYEVPEKVIKAAQSTAPGLRREDFTDIPGPEQPGGDLRKEAMLAAFNLAGTSLPFAQSGAAGIFGGRLAKGADQAALARAEEMAAAGADRKAIWDQTGWFQGGDKKWRFEIPDYHSQMKQDWHDKGVPNYDASKIAGQLWHKPLYDAYPDIRHATGVVERTQNTMGGSYVSPTHGQGSERINIQAPNAPAVRSVALHEIQHAIQEREGFARGGSPLMFEQADEAKLARDALSWRKEMDRFPGTVAEKNIAAEKSYRDLDAVDWMPGKEARFLAMDVRRNPNVSLEQLVQLYGLDKQTTPFSPKDLYRSVPGEIEARNVQARMDMTPEELRAKPPWETMHWMDTVASSPALDSLFSGRVGMLER